MKNLFVKIHGTLLILIILLLIIPFIQSEFNLIKLTPLKGAFTQSEKTHFNISNWFSGTYQEQGEKYLNETFGFRNLFIRINNQLAFSFFNKANVWNVIIGKKNYLYDEIYIKAYYGTDFIGIDSTMHRMQKLKYIQDTLSKLNKDIILVFGTGKGSFYPEYIPDRYKTKKGLTNYEIHVNLAQKMDINLIDFNKYFLKNKDKLKYPLYPQYGIHWSNYAMCIAADSIIRYIEKKRKIDMPNLFWNAVELSQPKEVDYDIADGMNLLFKLKSFNMAYPNIQFESDSNKTKPSVLVISDSFYWGMFNFGITNAFTNSHFWYYNKEIYPDSYQSPLVTSKINLKNEISRHDVIIIMATEPNLTNLGWGFIENAYNLFKGEKKQTAFDAKFQTKITNLRNYIKSDKKWMEDIKKKAILNKVSVDSMLTLDAIWQIQHENKKQ